MLGALGGWEVKGRLGVEGLEVELPGEWKSLPARPRATEGITVRSSHAAPALAKWAGPRGQGEFGPGGTTAGHCRNKFKPCAAWKTSFPGKLQL